MSQIKISIKLPDKKPERHKADKPCIVEYARELISEIEAGYASPKAWKSALRLFERMVEMKSLTPKQKAAFKLLEPCIRKHGQGRTSKLAAEYPVLQETNKESRND